jgi:hypothetical protein
MNDLRTALGRALCRWDLHAMRPVREAGLALGPPTLNRCRRCGAEELDWWD